MTCLFEAKKKLTVSLTLTYVVGLFQLILRNLYSGHCHHIGLFVQVTLLMNKKAKITISFSPRTLKRAELIIPQHRFPHYFQFVSPHYIITSQSERTNRASGITSSDSLSAIRAYRFELLIRPNNPRAAVQARACT